MLDIRPHNVPDISTVHQRVQSGNADGMRRTAVRSLRSQRRTDTGHRAEPDTAAEHHRISARHADVDRAPRPAAALPQLVAGVPGGVVFVQPQRGTVRLALSRFFDRDELLVALGRDRVLEIEECVAADEQARRERAQAEAVKQFAAVHGEGVHRGGVRVSQRAQVHAGGSG